MAQRGYCKNCRFYGEVTKDCRHNPPERVGDLLYGQWPGVTENDWCGKFEIDGSTVPNQTRSF